MFTGIIAETGKVEEIQTSTAGIQLTVRMRTCGRGLRKGDSVAVNGCCLTVVKVQKKLRDVLVRFDLLRETWSLTNLQFAKRGSLVNLERPLRASGRLDGHFVTGHIDGLGKIRRLEKEGADRLLDIEPSPELMRYIVHKGSIAVDGISLTVAGVNEKSFRVWIIPHTWKATALREHSRGSLVSLETDLLGKYVHRLISSTSKC
jgi:riboflavin synthase